MGAKRMCDVQVVRVLPPQRDLADLLCSNGCGLDVGVKDGKIVGVRGRATDRVNRGRLGPKGLYSYVEFRQQLGCG
jgi:anaerobic selenocysteine-containing dehydrogenase